MYLGINIALENIFHEWLDSTSLKSFTLQWIFHRSKFNITYTKKKKKLRQKHLKIKVKFSN